MRWLTLIYITALFVAASACQAPSDGEATLYLQLKGETMGTYYAITYGDEQQRDFKASIDSLLKVINSEVNTYDPSSTISRFNQAEEKWPVAVGESQKLHFTNNFELAKKIVALSGEALDPTVMPLVNYWGFGYEKKEAVTAVDSNRVDSLMSFVGMGKVGMLTNGDTTFLVKDLPGVQLDFSALAKGYAVDKIGEFLFTKNINNYLVEIGGEVVCRGVNAKGQIWNIAINDPRPGAGLSDFVAVLPLDNKGMATSGNYRNFYEVDGKKYGHTINPKTGFPEKHELISASIVAMDCMTADALATACMVKGPNGAFEMIEEMKNVDGFFVYRKDGTELDFKYTEGLSQFFEEQKLNE